MPKQTNNVTSKSSALQYIRTIYLSIAAVIALVCFIIGASGALKLTLNIWFPVDENVYYSPYDQSPCQYTWNPDGKQVERTPAEIAKCERNTQRSQAQMAKANFNRQLSESVAMMLVGFPIWLLHFWLIQLDWKKRNNN